MRLDLIGEANLGDASISHWECRGGHRSAVLKKHPDRSTVLKQHFDRSAALEKHPDQSAVLKQHPVQRVWL